ncbi:MAG: tripartite tricarboxylate transporter substrate binding protein [Betaproteobacteria bacterium]|nr:tripartite tricarboxylate transporter substrate binding protein [Betaproteobacteria bacterium]
MKSKRRFTRVMVAAGAAALLGQAVAAAAQGYPDKPVRIVVAFAAGGFADGNGRLVAQKVSERLGQPFVIDNRGGAGGTYGAKIVADATPDGYSILVTTAASTVAPSLYKNIGFNLLKDFTPIANTVSAAGVFSVLASHPATDLKDYIQRSRGRQINFATAGVGTSSHIAADYLLRVLAKLDATHVPFKGGGPAVVAVLGGQIELLNSSGAALAHIQAGRMKGLAVASLKRTSSMPNVPTVEECGFPGFQERSWVGFFAPAGTPRAIVNLLNREINRALTQKDVIANANVRGMDLHPGSADDFSRFVHAEVAKWAKMVKLTGVRVE